MGYIQQSERGGDEARVSRGHIMQGLVAAQSLWLLLKIRWGDLARL